MSIRTKLIKDKYRRFVAKKKKEGLKKEIKESFGKRKSWKDLDKFEREYWDNITDHPELNPPPSPKKIRDKEKNKSMKEKYRWRRRKGDKTTFYDEDIPF